MHTRKAFLHPKYVIPSDLDNRQLNTGSLAFPELFRLL